MSYFDYAVSQELAVKDYPFYALIMTAMRQADTRNAEALREIFPETWRELETRYHSPGGRMPGEEEGIGNPHEPDES